MTLGDEITRVVAAAQRVELAGAALEAAKNACAAQAKASGGSADVTAVLAYHAAWIDVRAAVDAFVAIPRPLDVVTKLALAVAAEQSELEAPTNPEVAE